MKILFIADIHIKLGQKNVPVAWAKNRYEELNTQLTSAQKLADMRAQVDQSIEYMKLQAVKGIMKTPDGSVIADMFTEFSVTQM